MRQIKNKKVLITLASSAAVLVVLLTAVVFLDSNAETETIESAQAELDSGDSIVDNSDAADGKDSIATNDQNEQAESNDSIQAENTTVVVAEVEFQPIPENEVPEEIPTLPVVTNHYKIEQLNDGFFEIELYAILNRPEQYQEYLLQLTQFKQEALNYLTENQYEIQSSRISYIPAEAAQL